MKIAIQGELGSFSHEAALIFEPKAKIVTCALSREVFEAVESHKVDAAVIPIENSLAGPVSEHFDLLLESKLFIRQEYRLRIRHNLIAAPGVKFADVRRVYSHPIALGQCRGIFRKYPKLQALGAYDTAGSVKQVVEGGWKDAAAIASEHAAAQYGGVILRKGIEDNSQNFTRFFYAVPAGSKAKPLPEANKTSIAFRLPNAPGALFKALSVFALREIDLSKIESRPVPGRPWEYVFFADLLCGDVRPARLALDHLREFAEMVRVLGIYPESR
jgi:prephenate dehydratase